MEEKFSKEGLTFDDVLLIPQNPHPPYQKYRT